MATDAFCVAFSDSITPGGGTGSKDLTDANLGGNTPKAMILWIGDDAAADHEQVIAFVDASGWVSFQMYNNDGSSTSQSATERYGSNIDFPTVYSCDFDFTALIADGLRINVNDAPNVNIYFSGVAFYGTNITVDIGVEALVQASKTVSLAFTPDYVFTLAGVYMSSAGVKTDDIDTSFGISDGTNHCVVGIFDDHGDSTMDTRSYHGDNLCVCGMTSCHDMSIDTDEFTWTRQSGSTNRTMAYLAISGIDLEFGFITNPAGAHAKITESLSFKPSTLITAGVPSVWDPTNNNFASSDSPYAGALNINWIDFENSLYGWGFLRYEDDDPSVDCSCNIETQTAYTEGLEGVGTRQYLSRLDTSASYADGFFNRTSSGFEWDSDYGTSSNPSSFMYIAVKLYPPDQEMDLDTDNDAVANVSAIGDAVVKYLLYIDLDTDNDGFANVSAIGDAGFVYVTLYDLIGQGFANVSAVGAATICGAYTAVLTGVDNVPNNAVGEDIGHFFSNWQNYTEPTVVWTEKSDVSMTWTEKSDPTL